jgi:hypothetical protein
LTRSQAIRLLHAARMGDDVPQATITLALQATGDIAPNDDARKPEMFANTDKTDSRITGETLRE